MRKTRIIIYLFLSLFVLFIYGCSDEIIDENRTKITYVLEGGEYKNCKSDIIHYYEFEKDSNLIAEPQTLTGDNVNKNGYVFSGWYQTKIVNGDEIIYEDEWDFDNDVLTTKELTLYACWKKDTKFSYEVGYLDENKDNVFVLIGTYNVDVGQKFSDYKSYSKKRAGYTMIEYQDESGNLWNPDFTHPGGETDLAIKVIVKYVKGFYQVVHNASELIKSINSNIYLYNDIDLNSTPDKEVLFSFKDYHGTLLGNGYTIKNFSYSYDASINGLITDFDNSDKQSLCISLFGNTNGATISDLKIENVKININTLFTKTFKIYVAPLSVKMTNTKISNVSITGEITIEELPSAFNSEENLVIITNKVYYLSDDKSQIDNCEVNFIQK